MGERVIEAELVPTTGAGESALSAITRGELDVQISTAKSYPRNARRFIEVAEEFGSFTDYIWSFVDGRPLVNRWKEQRDVPSTSAQSDALSRDLKIRGFKFVGSTIIYAHMQAIGLVNDHLVDCYRYEQCRMLTA